MNRRQIIIFLILFGIGTFLIFFRLGRHDMLSDDAHFAFRAIGYFDYMASAEQTTPVQWFGSRPDWSLLSFHDHPPLFFFLQHWLFKIFGTSLINSRLLSAFAGTGSLLVIFFWGKWFMGKWGGLLSLGMFSINNYFIWTARIGLLESLFTFFLLLGLLFLQKGIEKDSNFLWSGLFFGFAGLTKYTLFFVLPGVFVYLLWRHRSVFINKKFWQGILIFLLVMSPVVIYNLAMYKTRGHFDVQFSDLFNQVHKDWTILAPRVSGLHFDVIQVAKIMISGFSWPYFLILVLSFLGTLFLAKTEKESAIYLPALTFISLFLFFSLIGNSLLWMGVISPFAALIIAHLISTLIRKEELVKNYFHYPLYGLLLSVSLFSLFYTLNSNTFHKPIGRLGWYSDFRIENYGYNQLDKKISSLLAYKRAPDKVQEAVRSTWFTNIQPKTIDFSSLTQGQSEFNGMLIYDSNTIWFPVLWIFDRWRFYHRFLVMDTGEYFKIIKNQSLLAPLAALPFDEIYFIEAGQEVALTSRQNFGGTSVLAEKFRQQNIIPQIIHDDRGREAFYIYQAKFR